MRRWTRTDASAGLICSVCGRAPREGALATAPEIALCERCVAEAAGLVEAPEDDHDRGAPIHDGQADLRDRGSIRLLSELDVARVLSMDDVIDAMKVALPRFSAGEVVQPVRLVMPVGHDRGFLGLMPAQLRDPDTLGAKLVSVFPGNSDAGLPTHGAVVLLFNPRTGRLVSVLDGRLITEMRTAAVSALSAMLLAREEAALLAVIGTGVQARSHVEALERVWTFSRIRAWSPTPAHCAAFEEEMEGRTSAPLDIALSAEDAVLGADVIVLATSSAEPVIDSEWVRSGAHVISVGACRPDQREMDPALVVRARLYVDSRAAALVESGDVVMGMAEGRFDASHIAGEIGDLIAQRIEGRTSDSQVTIFKSLGLAVEDVATAMLAFGRAVVHDTGTEQEW